MRYVQGSAVQGEILKTGITLAGLIGILVSPPPLVGIVGVLLFLSGEKRRTLLLLPWLILLPLLALLASGSLTSLALPVWRAAASVLWTGLMFQWFTPAERFALIQRLPHPLPLTLWIMLRDQIRIREYLLSAWKAWRLEGLPPHPSRHARLILLLFHALRRRSREATWALRLEGASPPSSPPRVDAVVHVQDLRFRYSATSPALQIPELHIRQGERVAVIGPNGSGKTTLLLLIAGLLRGTGILQVLGYPQPRAFAAIRPHVGMLFADPDVQILYPTVEEEILALQVHYPPERVREALLRFEIPSVIHQPTYHLSPGWKKRLILARLWIRTPRLWLLDEPSDGLDPAMRHRLVQDLQSLTGTLILATHDLDLALEVCTRVVVLQEGRMVADGSPGEILTDASRLHRWGLRLPLKLQGGDYG